MAPYIIRETNGSNIMKENYKSNLADGRQIYIPSWSATIQFENLTQACKYLGQNEVVDISALNVPAAMLAIMGSDDSKTSTELVIHFVQQVRIEGDKITKESIENMDMATIIELFTHVMHSQFHDFFESGLAKAPSQPL